jgi:non-ribosomal peptide synthetase component F
MRTHCRDRLGGLIPTAEPLAAAPAIYLSGPAALERTLVEILAATSAEHPHATAIDDGRRTVTYRRLQEEINSRVAELKAAGVGVGDRVGVRVESGTAELYVAILAVMAAGAAYVPVDADDPQERADLVFGEAGVSAVIGPGGLLEVVAPAHG